MLFTSVSKQGFYSASPPQSWKIWGPSIISLVPMDVKGHHLGPQCQQRLIVTKAYWRLILLWRGPHLWALDILVPTCTQERKTRFQKCTPVPPPPPPPMHSGHGKGWGYTHVLQRCSTNVCLFSLKGDQILVVQTTNFATSPSGLDPFHVCLGYIHWVPHLP